MALACMQQTCTRIYTHRETSCRCMHVRILVHEFAHTHGHRRLSILVGIRTRQTHVHTPRVLTLSYAPKTTSAERARRLEAFAANMDRIDELNRAKPQKGHTAVYGVSLLQPLLALSVLCPLLFTRYSTQLSVLFAWPSQCRQGIALFHFALLLFSLSCIFTSHMCVPTRPVGIIRRSTSSLIGILTRFRAYLEAYQVPRRSYTPTTVQSALHRHAHKQLHAVGTVWPTAPRSRG